MHTPLPPEDDDRAAPDADQDEGEDAAIPACVLCFNVNDPSGAGGLAADATAIASVGAHAMTVVTGSYARDTGEILEHFAFSDDAVGEQARTILEDVSVQVFKVGFVGSPDNVSAIAEVASDYPEVPLMAYMPNLSWWEDGAIDAYHDAFRELLLPQTTVLIGNHSTLWRWLLPDWSSQRAPGARDIAQAASELGVPYILVTGLVMPDQSIANLLASPEAVMVTEKFEHIEATFTGAGDTLSATLAGLVASGSDLPGAAKEALNYLNRCLIGGFRPGMGHVLPDRLFWAQPEDDEDDDEAQASPLFLEIPPHETKH